MGWLDDVGDFADSAGSLISAGGAIYNYFAKDKAADAAKDTAKINAANTLAAAKANAKISRYDAEVAEENADEVRLKTIEEFKVHHYNTNKLLGQQRSRLAKSGVVTTVGTPAHVMATTAKNAYKDGQTILRNGKNAEDQMRSLASRYRMLADNDLRDGSATAYYIRQAGSNAAEMYTIQATTEFATNMYNLNKQYELI